MFTKLTHFFGVNSFLPLKFLPFIIFAWRVWLWINWINALENLVVNNEIMEHNFLEGLTVYNGLMELMCWNDWLCL